MEKEGRFQTRDLYLGAAVSLITGLNSNCELDDKGKVFFVFPEDESVWKAVMSYHAGAVCVVSEYVERVKALRSAMFAARGPSR